MKDKTILFVNTRKCFCCDIKWITDMQFMSWKMEDNKFPFAYIDPREKITIKTTFLNIIGGKVYCPKSGMRVTGGRDTDDLVTMNGLDFVPLATQIIQ